METVITAPSLSPSPPSNAVPPPGLVTTIARLMHEPRRINSD